MKTNALRFIACCFLALCCQAAWAAGNVAYTLGEVSILNRDGEPRGVRKGDRITAGETIITGRDGELIMTTDDSGVLSIRPRSRLLIESYQVNGDGKDSVVLNLLRGGLRSITGWISKSAPENYKLRTRAATVGIRGTDHETAIVDEVLNSGVWNQVTQGSTSFSNAAGTLTQVAGAVSATARVRTKDAAPEVTPAPDAIFFKRSSDAIIEKLRDDAQQNQALRLQLRRQQVAFGGGLTAPSNPRVSTQCAPNSPA